MSYINPLVGTPLSGALAQQQAATEKTRQVRRAQTVARNIAAESDRLEHQVENAEGLAPIHDEGDQQPRQRQSRKRKSKGTGPSGAGEMDEGEQHIDVKA